MHKRAWALVLLLPASGLALGACGSSSSTPTTTSSQAPKSSLPAAYATGITEAVTAWYPPYSERGANGSPAGEDADLGRAIAQALGVKIDVSAESFEEQLLQLSEGKVEMVPAVTLTAAREKMYSMVTYDIDGYSLATIKAEPSLGKTYASMCGHTIADELGDVAIPVMNAWSSKCKASGNKGITVLTFPSESAAELSVQSGRTQYVAGGISTLGYLAKTSKAGTWRLTGPTFLTGLTAIALSKGSSLAPYIVQAINKLIANGTYGHIMEENGMAANEITHSALSPKV